MIITLALLTKLLNALVITYLLGLVTYLCKPLLHNLVKVSVLDCGSNVSDHCILGFKASLSHIVIVPVPIAGEL